MSRGSTSTRLERTGHPRVGMPEARGQFRSVERVCTPYSSARKGSKISSCKDTAILDMYKIQLPILCSNARSSNLGHLRQDAGGADYALWSGVALLQGQPFVLWIFFG